MTSGSLQTRSLPPKVAGVQGPPKDHRDHSSRRLSLVVVGVLYASVGVNLLMAGSFALNSLDSWLLIVGLVTSLSVCLTFGSFELEKCPWRSLIAVVLQFFLLLGMCQLDVTTDHLWLLAMPPVSLAAYSLSWPLIVGNSAAFLFVVIRYSSEVSNTFTSIVEGVLGFGSAVVFAVAFTRIARSAMITREEARTLATKLEQANDQLRAAAGRTAQLAAMSERNRIARDIHDGLGHYLTTVAVQLEAARRLITDDRDRALDAVAKAEILAREALDEVRRSVSALRSQAPTLPLCEAIGGLVAESGLKASMVCSGPVRPLPDEAETTLFRIAQEGLTNVRKHAGPASVTLTLSYAPERGVSLEIIDTGYGPGTTGTGFGLSGLRERLSNLRGELEAGPGPTGGFRLWAHLPL